MNNTNLINQKLNNLPSEPGVYIMKDSSGEIIYIGKALSLKNRVRQYFNSSRKLPKVELMVRNIADFDYVLVENEKEALILECNLIKKHKPKYNILLKDDKRFPYIKITTTGKFPRAEVVREIKDTKDKYFGPYLSAIVSRELIEIFNLRRCAKNIELAKKRNERPCLNYQIGKCFAPCAGKISEAEYSVFVRNVCEFLSGDYHTLISRLNEQMNEYSKNLEYEKCIKLRDQINAVKKMAEKQIVDKTNLRSVCAFAVCVSDEYCGISGLFLENGKITDVMNMGFENTEENSGEILAGAIMQYYFNSGNVPPPLILVPEEIPGKDNIISVLSSKFGKKVEIKVPKKGGNLKLVELAKKNAFETLNRKLVRKNTLEARTMGAVNKLSEILGLENLARRIECYDISNTQGTDSVGSMVVFLDGKSAKKEYRRFKIKTVTGSDDFASIAEVLERRLLRTLNGDKGFSQFPDLIVIDGGKGQLSSAIDVLASLGLEYLPIISLAKRLEEVYAPGESDPIILENGSHELNLLTNIRDEAHRFAITYHRAIRQNRTVTSELLNIPGIGKKRTSLLLAHFNSLDELKNASIDELSNIDGIDKTSAKAIYDYFHEVK